MKKLRLLKALWEIVYYSILIFQRYIWLFAIAGLFIYSVIGTASRVDEIKSKAPTEIKNRGWKILRYDGYQYGSWMYHGGKVWYHVADTANSSIQYRVFITLWDDELHFYYQQPEILQRININKGEGK